MSFGTFSTTLFTIYRYGLPWRTKPSGTSMDIARIRHQATHQDNDAKKLKQFIKIQGLRESANENSIPEKFFNNTDGISAVKALKLAQQQGQKIYSINHFNKNNILPKLTAHSAKTLADVNNALNSGKEVTISEKPIKFYDWKGAGYIIIDTQTGAGAYMLEGNTNGNWTKNLKKKDQQFISSITYKKPRSRSIARFVVEQIVEEVVFSFIKHLIENSDELSECHKRVLLQFVALVEAALLISDVVGLLKASPARIMLSAVVPLLVIPVAYATTRALVACDKCDSDTSSRSNSVRANGEEGDNCWSKLPNDAIPTNLKTAEGKKVHTFIDPKIDKRVTAYKGEDGKWYKADIEVLPGIKILKQQDNKATRPLHSSPQKPKGDPEAESSPDIKAQNDAAVTLANNKYDVVQLPYEEHPNSEKKGNGFGVEDQSKPDFLINGRVFDSYNPRKNTTLKKIRSRVRGKIDTQAKRIIVTMNDSSFHPLDLKAEFKRYGGGSRLKEVIAIKDNKIYHVYVKKEG